MYNPLYPDKPSKVSAKLDTLQAPINEGLSTSALINDNPGICPKCKRAYTKAKLVSGEEVYFCLTDRVTAPMEA